MANLVMMGLQMGMVLVGFMGAGKMLEWYHKDTSSKGAVKNGLGRRSKKDEDDFFYY